MTLWCVLLFALINDYVCLAGVEMLQSVSAELVILFGNHIIKPFQNIQWKTTIQLNVQSNQEKLLLNCLHAMHV